MSARRIIRLLALPLLLLAGIALAHTVAEGDQDFVRNSAGAQIVPFIYLGAKHMVTGYDHLLFLAGVIFFLYRLKEVALYVTLFAVGHSATLLLGVLTGLHVNPFLIDAIIGLSVVYKALDNLDAFRTLFGWQPNAKLAVLVFGFFHGFGLATKLQELNLSRDGLVSNMLAFNVGVEIGQLLALSAILLVMNYWRRTASFTRHAHGAAAHRIRHRTMNAQPPQASRRRLLVSTLVAALAAAAILVAFVLPAEYAIDPLGIGRLVGLDALGTSKASKPITEVMHAHPRKYYSGNITIDVSGREELEYKATLAAGEPMLYSWRVQGGPVYFEFHGEPTEGKWPAGFYRSYEIQQRASESHGSFIAPFTGQHGWYWRNLSDEPAIITLQASGYYSRLGRIESKKAAVE
jgi:hypothetical protein